MLFNKKIIKCVAMGGGGGGKMGGTYESLRFGSIMLL